MSESGPQAPAASRRDGSWSVELRPTRLRFGAGTLSDLGELAVALGGGRALIVTDPGVRSAGHVDRAAASLERAGVHPFVFDGVEENPEERHVAAGVEAARRSGCDLLVGLGGGSAMDCAKGINFVLTNGGRMQDYWGMGKAARPMLPSIGVPGTAGTGSEAQSFALISREGDHRKMACGDEKARFHWVILDPEVAATAPREVVAATGLDAISHAVESCACTVGNRVSRLFAREAWQTLDRWFGVVLGEPASLEAWGEMLLGAHFGGAAIEASMLGAAHALANPLSAAYGITHGAAVAVVLPHVVRFNGGAAESRYRELIGDAARRESQSEASAAIRLAARLEELRTLAGLPSRIEEMGVEKTKLSTLAEQAAEQWTARFNPRPVGAADLLQLYQEAW